MTAAQGSGSPWQLARMSLTHRSLYPFVLSALAGIEPARRAAFRVLDLPAGDGVLSFALRAAGFDVTPADLFPEYLHDRQKQIAGRPILDVFREMTRHQLPGWLAGALYGPGKSPATPGDLRCIGADMEGSVPLPNAGFDAVVCVEGIEHVVDRHRTLAELRRLLKPGGRLILTTPNLMSFRARLAYALAGQRAFHSYVDEHTSVWGRSADGSRTYHGHAFLLTYFQLRYSLHHSGFRIRRLLNSNWSPSSILLSPVWPLVAVATWYSQRPAKRKYARLVERSAHPAKPDDLAYRLPPGAQEPYAQMNAHLLSPHLLWNATMVVEAEAA